MMTFSPFDPFTAGRGAALKADPLLALEQKLARAEAHQAVCCRALHDIEAECMRRYGKALPQEPGPLYDAQDAAQDAFDDAVAAVGAICDEAIPLRPVGMAGVRAKLRLASYFIRRTALNFEEQLDPDLIEPQEVLALRAIEDFERLAG